MLQALRVGVGNRVGNCNATLIVLMDNNWRDIGGNTNFKAQLAQPEKLASQINESTIFRLTGGEGDGWLLLGLPRN